MSALDASGEANALASAQAARSGQAAQVANIAARLERLPLTSYQKGIFAIIATAWFFDSMDLGALTFVLGSIRQTFQLSTAEAGLLSSMSFIGMFIGAASAGLLADRFGRAKVFQASMIFWGLGSLFCGLSSTVTMLGASRLLLGFGMGMEFPVAQSMVSEMIPAERRGRYIAYLEGFWPLGFIASGLLIYAVLSVADWHWVFILQAIPALFVLVIRRLRSGIAALARRPRPIRSRRGRDAGDREQGLRPSRRPVVACADTAADSEAPALSSASPRCSRASTPDAPRCCGRCGSSRCSASMA